MKRLILNKIASIFPDYQKDLERSFNQVSEFAKLEIKNYQHYAKLTNYSEILKEVNQERIQDLANLGVDKYIDKILYEKNANEIKHIEDEFSR